MKSKRIILCMSTLLAVSLLATGCGREIEVKNGSKVAVSVKGEKYTATEYYSKIKEDNITTLIDMIDTDLLEKKYKKADKTEENEYVESQMTQIKSYYGTNDETYNSVLKSYFGVENEEELETKLRLEFKRNQAVKDYITDHLTDKEIKKYYEDNIYGEVKVSHILIVPETLSSDATDDEKQLADTTALKKAENIISKLDGGTKFDGLAKKNSDDKATAANGGDLGYIDLNDVDDEFAEAVKKLAVDEYTKEPVKTKFGYHIILKTGEKDKPKLKEVKDKIKETLRDQKLSESNSLYYETLRDFRKENKIKWNDDVLKKAYNKYMDELIESAKSED